MPRGKHWGSDAGTASLEFITVGVILLIPLVYLVLVIGAIQSAALAAEGGARHAVRLLATGEAPYGNGTLERAVEFALADHGVTPSNIRVEVACSGPPPCSQRGDFTRVSVELAVPLPLVPVFPGVSPPTIPVAASATQQVSRWAGG
ncbi:hypothetical protein M2152_000660 [Microbacteriaceae bacterium SG_E_30_P1]|uniref:TadE-like protein n=1 Tax=Antiquaquibacter oligotrophicus TaxID=2880260 RepID=A0ABT6KKG0_9MICO|nr:hypothetical protein [Antiquaquibacter oligotrophicus]MDH6180478.1 hypothetical protein [Antiquaquibacter oligotrophicus]UDF13785.1 hypothetical protein LH407_02715 [Antiquaquibacter oligotrophicus]